MVWRLNISPAPPQSSLGNLNVQSGLVITGLRNEGAPYFNKDLAETLEKVWPHRHGRRHLVSGRSGARAHLGVGDRHQGDLPQWSLMLQRPVLAQVYYAHLLSGIREKKLKGRRKTSC